MQIRDHQRSIALFKSVKFEKITKLDSAGFFSEKNPGSGLSGTSFFKRSGCPQGYPGLVMILAEINQPYVALQSRWDQKPAPRNISVL